MLLAIIITVVFGTAQPTNQRRRCGRRPATVRLPRAILTPAGAFSQYGRPRHAIVPMAVQDKSRHTAGLSWRQSSSTATWRPALTICASITSGRGGRSRRLARSPALCRHWADAESAEQRVQHGLRRTAEQHHLILSVEIGDDNLPVCFSANSSARSSSRDTAPSNIATALHQPPLNRSLPLRQNLIFMTSWIRPKALVGRSRSHRDDVAQWRASNDKLIRPAKSYGSNTFGHNRRSELSP